MSARYKKGFGMLFKNGQQPSGGLEALGVTLWAQNRRHGRPVLGLQVEADTPSAQTEVAPAAPETDGSSTDPSGNAALLQGLSFEDSPTLPHERDADGDHQDS